MMNFLIQLFTCHRSDDTTNGGSVADFFLPKPTRGFFIRLSVVALLAALTFSVVLMPCFIKGESMLPTYPPRGLTFCWRGKYLFSEPKRGDIVVLKYVDRTYFLKRVVALAGDTVEFRNGDLYVNGVKQDEPYLHYVSDWNLPPRKVEPGHIYVVGDNRGMTLAEHRFGQVSLKRVAGSPIW